MARRSVLFTPGDRPEMLRKAPSAGADVIVFDLEDAVAPQRKADARESVRTVLADPEFDPDCEVCVRVNGEPPMRDADLEALLTPADSASNDDSIALDDASTDNSIAGDAASADDSTVVDDSTDADGTSNLRLDSVMLPKVSSAADVHDLEGELVTYDASIPVLALIESAAGVLAAPDIASAPATDALVFGAEDLSADIGATRTDDGTEVLYARERVVIAAAAHDCTAIDTIVADFEADDQLRRDAEFAVQLGYDGKLAIHPVQVDPINEAFTPTAEDLEWASRVLEAKREADADERGVFEVDGEMIDAPLIAQAERIRSRGAAVDE